MEVHAHTHTPRKKWTHYFWEFLMLFFAVFCGFLSRKSTRAQSRAQKGKRIYAVQWLMILKRHSGHKQGHLSGRK